MERAMCQSISKQKYASMEANIPEVILHVLKWFCNHQYLLDPIQIGTYDITLGTATFWISYAVAVQ